MISSLYIHIPFCLAKCNYCSFNSYSGREGLMEQYVKALGVECRNIKSNKGKGPLKTIFLGGGTPTLLPTDLLKNLFCKIATNFEIEKDAEISIEANPGTVDREKLDTLREAGVNRISIGIQSFFDTELKGLGRIHSAKEAAQAIAIARAAGIENLSIDLMYGLPQQTPKSWQESLERALSTDVQHLSMYQLTVEEMTPLAKMIKSDGPQLPGDDAIADMDDITASLTEKGGLLQYEISNYARDGFQCRHNINYWRNGEYFGIGAGAVMYLGGKRIKNTANPDDYCKLLESGNSVQVEKEYLDREASFRESVVMGLRMNRGVSVKDLYERYGIDLDVFYGKTVQDLCTRYLLKREAGHLQLTGKGRVYANMVMAELV